MSQPPAQSKPPNLSLAGPAPQFLIRLEPRIPALFSNLTALLRRSPRESAFRSVPFWPDVFVGTGLPWRSLMESALTHGLMLAAIWSLSHAWVMRPKVVLRASFHPSQIIYYSVSEYLPAIKSPSPRARVSRKADPAYAPQEIISVPPEADNREQTIIAPPEVKLASNLPMPNLVAWTPVPAPVTVPGSLNSRLTPPPIATPVISPPPDLANTTPRSPPTLSQPSAIAPPPNVASAANRAAPSLPQPRAIAPAPDISAGMAMQHGAGATQPGVVAPPPSMSAITRPAGALNVADLQPQVLAPRLPLAPQQSASAAVPGEGAGKNGRSAGQGGAAPVAAPPDAHAIGFGRPAGQVIALSVSPSALSGPINVPQGNRRGSFAAGPAGRLVASGAPGGNGGGAAEVGHGTTNTTADKLAGINVAPGPAPNPATTTAVVAATPSRNLLAFATAPFSMRTLPPRVHSDVPSLVPSEVDRQVFGAKKFYSITLNMPNLNSRSGSWVIRFAELNDDRTQGELTAPMVMEKVDPAYPGLIMDENIEGTVTLYAVIGADGSVANVRVLRGVDGRLDAAARDALQRCHFRPATKNGAAVPLEAVIRIPFEVHRISY